MKAVVALDPPRLTAASSTLSHTLTSLYLTSPETEGVESTDRMLFDDDGDVDDEDTGD